MSDLMLLGVLRMPLPDDPRELDVMTWLQFRARALEAADRIEAGAAQAQQADTTAILSAKVALWRLRAEAAEAKLDQAQQAEDRELALVIAQRDWALKQLNARPDTKVQQATTALSSAWADGYRLGVLDERTSESSIGVAGFGAKIEPARQNPYDATPAQGQQVDALSRDYARALDTINDLIVRNKALEQQEREHRAFRNMVNRHNPECPADPNGIRDVWYWQGDAEDHLESMTHQLPIVIRAEQLRELLAAAKAEDAYDYGASIAYYKGIDK